MHKFSIIIELADKDYCNGCPCFNHDYNGCNHYVLDNFIINDNNKIIRPDICKVNDKEGDNQVKEPVWDDLTYDEKEALRKKRPELWRKLYKEKFGFSEKEAANG